MEWKNALTTCLIALFAATLVLLIARALDLQTASRIEPQLERIAEELTALRKQGGLTATNGSAYVETIDDALLVYYFHGNQRCPTCRSIESYSQEVVHTDFPDEVERGELVWKALNYERPAVAPLAEEFEVSDPLVVLVRMQNGKIADSKPLRAVWAKVRDKPAFVAYVRDEIQRMIDAPDAQPAAAPDVPVPAAAPIDVPVPQ